MRLSPSSDHLPSESGRRITHVVAIDLDQSPNGHSTRPLGRSGRLRPCSPRCSASFLLFGVGFSHIEALHNAAHDTRHAAPSPATEAEEPGMAMFRSLVFAAALAGLLTGVLVTIAQQMGTVPLILAAEVFEQAEEPAAARAAGGRRTRPRHPRARGLGASGRLRAHRLHAGGEHRHRHGVRPAADRGLRPARAGDRLAPGLFWGLAGFAVFMLAPAHRTAARTARHAGRTVAATPDVVDRHRRWPPPAGSPCWSFRASPLWAVVAVALMVPRI